MPVIKADNLLHENNCYNNDDDDDDDDDDNSVPGTRNLAGASLQGAATWRIYWRDRRVIGRRYGTFYDGRCNRLHAMLLGYKPSTILVTVLQMAANIPGRLYVGGAI